MNGRRRVAALLAAACSIAACAQGSGPVKPASPHAAESLATPLAGFGWFAELAGSCWKGSHPDGKSADTQCYLVQYDRLMRGSIKIEREGAPRPVFEGDAVFSLEQAGKKTLVYTQWGTGGAYSTGQVTFEGETLVFRNRQPDGSDSDVRSVWRRTGPDGFRVTRERSVPDKGWQPLVEVDYHRVR